MYEIKDLYEKYKKDVFVYLISITHNKTLSEDLLSDTFLSAIGSIANFKGDSDIKTWLFSIARHKWYEYLRKNKFSAPLDIFIKYYIQEDFSLEKQSYQNELTERILELLEEENPRTKKIVLMRVEGYSFYEIGKDLKISEGSARVIDFRAKRKLKEVLVREGFDYE